MTTVEFSNEFDVLVDSYRRFKDFDNKEELDSLDFNEYEKSVFLSRAQDEIVVELYSGRGIKGSFEETEEVRKSLRNLIKTVTIKEDTGNPTKLYDSSQTFILPDDVLFITYESVKFNDSNAECFNGKNTEVVPVRQDELHRVMKNPFRRASRRRVLRVDSGTDTVDLISDYSIGSYTIWYLSKPTPIVLMNSSEVTVDGWNEIKECELDSVLHRPILERAVEMAVTSKGIRQDK